MASEDARGGDAPPEIEPAAERGRVRLRQAVLVARDLEQAVGDLQSRLGLGEPFRDPGVGIFGLENAVFALGDCFIEVVSPVRDDAPAARYLERTGGDGGYMVMFDLSDLASARERARALSLRTVWEMDLPDISGTHLHPSDLGGAIVSIDSSRPYGSWRWGGPAWTGTRPEPGPGRLRGVTLAVGDPVAVAGRWADLLGLRPSSAPEAVSIPTDGGWVRMTERSGEVPDRLVEIALEPPRGGGAEEEAVELLGVRFTLLEPTS